MRESDRDSPAPHTRSWLSRARNGVSLGLSAPGYSPLTPFVVQSGFVAGATLDFEVNDSGCPNGLRVELAGTAEIGG